MEGRPRRTVVVPGIRWKNEATLLLSEDALTASMVIRVHREKNHLSSWTYGGSDRSDRLIRNLWDIVVALHCALPPSRVVSYRRRLPTRRTHMLCSPS